MTPEQKKKVRAWLEYMRTEGRRNKDLTKVMACQFALDALDKAEGKSLFDC